MPQLADDERFARNRDRVVHVDALERIVTDALRADTAENWERRLVAAEIPAGRVATIDQVMAHPHTLARDMVVEMQTSECQPLRLLGNPLKMSGTPVRFTRAPPHLDQDRDAVLQELADLERKARV